MRWLAEPAFARLSGVWPQDAEQATRFRALGVRPHAPTGNLKFDMEPDLALWEQGQSARQSQPLPVLMLAVSREGEEQMWVEALRALRASAQLQANAAVQWLIVPRHPQRFDAVAALPAERRSVVISGAGDRRDEDLRRQTQILGDAFDDVILYQDAAQRGRSDGEVIALLREGLADARRTRRIDEIRGEFIAIDLALERLRPGDLSLILVDQVQEALEHIAGRIAHV
jgi:hypothetical protein